MIYHSGELAVQSRVGVQAEAESLAKAIGGAVVKPAMQSFLASQRLAIASTIDSGNRVWASLLTGEPGFLQAVAEQIVKIAIDSDELKENLRLTDELGLLVIDLATRKRLRLNGKAKLQGENKIYFIPSKYISTVLSTSKNGKLTLLLIAVNIMSILEKRYRLSSNNLSNTQIHFLLLVVTPKAARMRPIVEVIQALLEFCRKTS